MRNSPRSSSMQGYVSAMAAMLSRTFLRASEGIPGRVVLGLAGVLALTMLPGITTCNTTCTELDPQGNPIQVPCLSCSIPGSEPCMDNVWNIPVDSTCLEEQRPIHEDGTPCDDGAGVCQAGVCVSIAFPCTEQGIRDAIAAGGGPQVFDCDGPTIVPTTSEIFIDNDVALDGEGKLTVDAAGAHQVIRVQSGVTAELRGIAISGGGGVDRGGGIYNSGTLTVADATLTFNNATLHGGAIYTGVGDTLVLDNVIVENNGATRGGAVYVQQGEALIYNSRFANNFATEMGGAIYTSFSSSLTLTDSQVLSNQLSTSAGVRGTGGGISSGGTLALHNSTVSGNDAGLDGFGGGIYSEEDLVLDGSTVSDNVTEGSLGIGGGMFIGGGSQSTITRSSLSGNAAGWNGAGAAVSGGAISISESTISDNRNLGNAWGSGLLVDSAVATFTNSTFSGNNGPGVGAIALGAATIVMQNCTVSGNSMAYGGGIYAAWASDVTLVHTTMSGNTATASGGAIYLSDADSTVTVQNSIIDGDCDGAGTMQSAGYNIESPADTCNLTEPTDWLGDPDLGPLQDNGGETLTQVPVIGSFALNQIPEADCLDLYGAPLTTDQRGIARPQSVLCDVGAIEFGPPDAEAQLEFDEVYWELTGNGEPLRTGTIDTSAPDSAASVEVFGLPPGSGYSIEMFATSVEGWAVSCVGSAIFDAAAGYATLVDVMMDCDSGMPQVQGHARVGGRFASCTPQLTLVIVGPLETSVGNDINLAAIASGTGNIYYLWTSSSGAIDDANASTTSYTCYEAGDHFVTITVSEGIDSCDWTVPVTCVYDDPG